MTLSDLIGLKISKIRYSYQWDNGYGMQEFRSYIKFSNGKIIFLPSYPDTRMDLVANYEQHKPVSFLNAKRCGIASRVLFKNKRIVDIHFQYLDGKALEDANGILELDNGKFITENNIAPQTAEDLSLIILSKKQFLELGKGNIELRSLTKDILN